MDDLPKYNPPSAKINQTVDDTAIMVNTSNKSEMEVQLNHILSIVSLWSFKNKLSLNLKKIFWCIFGTHDKCENFIEMEIKHDNNIVESKGVAKYLGMQFDSSLTFSKHKAYIRSKKIGEIKLLGRTRNNISHAYDWRDECILDE